MSISHETRIQDVKVLTTNVLIRHFTKNTHVIPKCSFELVLGFKTGLLFLELEQAGFFAVGEGFLTKFILSLYIAQG